MVKEGRIDYKGCLMRWVNGALVIVGYFCEIFSTSQNVDMHGVLGVVESRVTS